MIVVKCKIILDIFMIQGCICFEIRNFILSFLKIWMVVQFKEILFNNSLTYKEILLKKWLRVQCF